MGRISYKAAPSNLNYYIHFAGGHRHYDARFEIALLHYHDVSLNARGLIEPKPKLNSIERIALQKANNQIARGNADSMLARPRLRPASGIRQLDCTGRDAAGFSGLANGGTEILMRGKCLGAISILRLVFHRRVPPNVSPIKIK